MTIPQATYKEVSRPVLVASYQHLLLSLGAGLLLAWSILPFTGVLIVAAAQTWRLRVMRRGEPTSTPNPLAAWHASRYFARAQATLLLLAIALVLGLVLTWTVGGEPGRLATKIALSAALFASLLVTTTGYLRLTNEKATW